MATRRQILLAAMGAVAPVPGAATARLRVATVDWAVLETLLALDVTPVAATELLQFREVAVEPEVPAGVADLGLRGTVNFEMLRLTRPDLILSSNFYASSEPRLRLIAPVESFSIYAPGRPPFMAAEAMTRAIADRLSLGDAASRFLADTHAEFSTLRAQIPSASRLPVIPINLGDTRHFRVFGADSMFGESLARLGLENAWTLATSYSAMAPVGLEALARIPEAWIALISPSPPDALRVLNRSAFWNALPNIRAGRLLNLDPINPYGGLPAARRFARLLVRAIVETAASRPDANRSG